MRKTFVLFVCVVSFTTRVAYSQTQSNPLGQDRTFNPITTSVPFLLIGPDSRIGGMGETGAAILDDANAQHWNPAKYLFAQKDVGISLSYSPWLAGLNIHDIHLLYLSTYYKVTTMDAISFSLRYFSMGKMDITDYAGTVIMTAQPHEFAIDGAYSRVLVENLSMAVTGRFIYSHLSNYSVTQDIKAGMSGAADISLFYTKKFRPKNLYNHNLNVGLNISNIGAKISYSSTMKRDFLPANFRFGLAYEMWIDKYNKFTLAADANKLLVTSPPVYQLDDIGQIVYENGEPVIAKGRNPYQTPAPVAVFTSWFDAPNGFKEEMQEYILNFGLEYAYNNLLFIRAGYFNEAINKGNRKYITVGVGVKYSVFAIDASYIIPIYAGKTGGRSPLENTLRFTLSFDFDVDRRK